MGIFVPEQPGYAWQSGAACRGVDSDLFFPATEVDAQPAKMVCDGCAVRDQCLAFALANSERYGVWGGMTERERPELSPRQREAIRRRAARKQHAA